jgi:hypothetical protein
MFQTPFSDRIRNEAGLATMAVGNITEADQVNGILLAGRADLVCLARPHLADPYWTLHAAVRRGHGTDWPLPYLAGRDQAGACGEGARGDPGMTLAGKRVLITGGGTGAGADLARGFAAAGAEVVISGRREEALRPCCRTAGAAPGAGDVTDEASSQAMFAEAGPCDIVIANAGAADSAPMARPRWTSGTRCWRST